MQNLQPIWNHFLIATQPSSQCSILVWLPIKRKRLQKLVNSWSLLVDVQLWLWSMEWYVCNSSCIQNPSKNGTPIKTLKSYWEPSYHNVWIFRETLFRSKLWSLSALFWRIKRSGSYTEFPRSLTCSCPKNWNKLCQQDKWWMDKRYLLMSMLRKVRSNF